jgi:hypothetical protein
MQTVRSQVGVEPVFSALGHEKEEYPRLLLLFAFRCFCMLSDAFCMLFRMLSSSSFYLCKRLRQEMHVRSGLVGVEPVSSEHRTHEKEYPASVAVCFQMLLHAFSDAFGELFLLVQTVASRDARSIWHGRR